jgi:hypothetical protein
VKRKKEDPANFVDAAWRTGKRYQTEADAKAYAEKMLQDAFHFSIRLNNTPSPITEAKRYETVVLTSAGYRNEVCAAGKEADMVDAAWSATDATFNDFKAYAREMLDAAQTFHDEIHWTPCADE